MVGRPTKYDPSNCGKVVSLMAKGLSKDAVAGKLGISRDTLYECVRLIRSLQGTDPTLSLGVSTTEWLKNKLKESHQDEVEFRNNALKSLNEGLTRITKRLDEVYDDKLDGVIDETTYHQKGNNT